MKADTILFDLDGTLWNSVAGISVSWQAIAEKYGCRRSPITDEEISRCMGFDLDDMGEMIFPEVPLQDRSDLLNECIREEHAYLRDHGGALYPGVKETLQILSKDHKLAVISNCEDGYIECFFEITGVGRYFADHECIGHSGMAKGDNILAVMKRLHSEKAVYVGDMIKDQLAAEYAGIPFVFASYGFGNGKLRPTRWAEMIDAFPQLVGIME